MPTSPKKPSPQAYTSEISLQSTRHCLVNLPSALVSVLTDNNKLAQDIVVEITFIQPQPSSPVAKPDKKPSQKSLYVGWTGFQSKRKLTSLITKDGGNQRGAALNSRDHEVPLVEIDATFGKLVGLSDGLKVGVFLHTDPPQAHTIHIEPLSPADWEIIELHANFLEINLLSQIRALPNPAFKSTGSIVTHPLTLHLSPTSTANILVTSLAPPPPASSPFAKIAPDAEVIVAPKTRAKPVSNSRTGENRSVRSTDAKSTASPARTRTRRAELPSRSPVFLRGVDRGLSDDWFDPHEEADQNDGLRLWVDWSVLTSKEMRRVTWAFVSIVRPSGLQAAVEPQQIQEQDSTKPATCVVAQVYPWEDAPDACHVALSTQLCSILGSPHMAGETIRLEAAPAQVSRQSVRGLKILPFVSTLDKQSDGLQFGGKSKADREDAAKIILSLYGNSRYGTKLFEGPITDGMLLPGPVKTTDGSRWIGGLVKFEPPPDQTPDAVRPPRAWLLAADRRLEVKSLVDSADTTAGAKLSLEVMSETIPLPSTADKWAVGKPIPVILPSLAGVGSLIGQLTAHIEHGSSMLLTGGHGSGKTSIAQFLASRFRQSEYFYTNYCPCTKFSADETRLSSIKDELSRVFCLAAWGARLGGHSLIILDDIDAVCSVETELQVGNDNGRSRHISETITSLSRQHCAVGSRIVVLATAKSKEDVNNLIIGGHVVREIVNIPAPDKDTRRTILEAFISKQTSNSRGASRSEPIFSGDSSSASDSENLENGYSSKSINGNGNGNGPHSDFAERDTGFIVNPSVDLLDLAGRTDGFMPGDLLLLTSRARSEALIRNVSEASSHDSRLLELSPSDFDTAIKGFTPSSLRNVTLQHSHITFASIGGLRSTRQTLLETLQYPTLYAPIFSRCPLRLRSGLLLYGYPGCGKTLLASAVAGECGLNFISVKGPEILNKYIGASEKSVRDLFERAQAAKPCVLFFDEFDSIAPKRGHDSTGVTDRVVNQLLTQMDGAEGLSGVYVLAATSRPDLIDPALLRPGRLDKSLLCDMPDVEDRCDILRALSQKLKMAPGIVDQQEQTNGEHLSDLARQTEGYSGADLQAVVYNAHLEAIHDLLGDRNQIYTKISRPTSSEASAGTIKAIQDFTYFRFGDKAGGVESATLPAAAKAAERAQITAHLKSHRASQVRARAARHASLFDGLTSYDAQSLEKKEDREPVIRWEHIERSLAQTRPSISQEERMRLARIYREFVVGRNGEMPSGQGGSEIGGRSSLM